MSCRGTEADQDRHDGRRVAGALRLGCAVPLADDLGWTDTINTHMSVRIPGEPNHFLINNYGEMFDEITASSLVKMDIDGKVYGEDGQLQQRRLHHPQRRLQGAARRQLRACTPIPGPAPASRC